MLQAFANVRLWALPPKLRHDVATQSLPLPHPVSIALKLKALKFEADVLTIASQAPTGEIDWRRDLRSGRTSSLAYFKLIPYLDFPKVGDHKVIWDRNRHQHLVIFAQAYLFSGNPVWMAEIRAQLATWRSQNPFLKGINWTSALEVALRSLSWIWIDHFVGPTPRLSQSLQEHGAYLETNLSTYFSPNTHLLGEAVALHAIGLKLQIKRWRLLGARIVEEQLESQIQADGSHFEQSTYYHVFALDLFLLHYILAGKPAAYREKLRRMARFLAVIMGQARSLTFFGDDDGGRLFHPYGPTNQFGRATLATCAILFPEDNLPIAATDLAPQAAWWLGVTEAAATAPCSVPFHFPDSGLTVMAHAELHTIIDAGPFGRNGAGHSHADTLSITTRAGNRDILIDPGTYTYVADPSLRDAFRGTGFHNTIRIHHKDQADVAGPFRWEQKPVIQVFQAQRNFLDAECRFRGFAHRRRVLAIEDRLLLVLDRVTGPPGQHPIEQFWHLGDDRVRILLSDAATAVRESGLRSRVFGHKESAPVIRAAWRTTLPHFCAAAIPFAPYEGALHQVGLLLTLPGWVSVLFAEEGLPAITFL